MHESISGMSILFIKFVRIQVTLRILLIFLNSFWFHQFSLVLISLVSVLIFTISFLLFTLDLIYFSF